MEGKNNTNLTTLVAVLVTLVLCLGGFVVYSSMANKNEKTPTDVITNTSSDVKDTNTVTTIEKSADERYREFIANLKKGAVNFNANEYVNTQRMVLNNNNGSLRINEKYELWYKGPFAKNNDFKIADNVIYMFTLAQDGNTRNYDLYFLKVDGKVYKVALLDENYEVFSTLQTVSSIGLKNIVGVSDSSWSTAKYTSPIFVDIEGNIHYLEN